MASSDKGEGKEARAVMRLSPRDNVAVALRPLKSGEIVTLDGAPITIRRHIAVGHKFAAHQCIFGIDQDSCGFFVSSECIHGRILFWKLDWHPL